jgi:hypothetical protein
MALHLLGSFFEDLHHAPVPDDAKLDALAMRILDEGPKTLLGLVIRARAEKWLRRHLWKPSTASRLSNRVFALHRQCDAVSTATGAHLTVLRVAAPKIRSSVTELESARPHWHAITRAVVKASLIKVLYCFHQNNDVLSVK